MPAAFDRITRKPSLVKIAAGNGDAPGNTGVADHLDISIQRLARGRQTEGVAAFYSVEEIMVAAEIEVGDGSARQHACALEGEHQAQKARFVNAERKTQSQPSDDVEGALHQVDRKIGAGAPGARQAVFAARGESL